LSLSPAKSLADEYWNISWSDIDTLEKKCVENDVNGVLAGFSEFRVEQMIKLCDRLKFPCNLTLDQLDVTRDKVKFKMLCQRYGIPTVKEYSYDSAKKFPIIIKPVDRAGSIGINVADNEEEFRKFYQIAESLSPTNNVIIEDFISNGIKFDIYYYIQDGTPYFLGSSDTLMCKKNVYAKILQKAWIFPSKYESVYINNYQDDILKMLSDLEINNCYLTMSAFYQNGRIYFFEAGFRLSGEKSYNWYKSVADINYLDCTINFSLGLQQPQLSSIKKTKHSVILNFFGIDGQVKRIQDNVISKCANVIAYNPYVQEGEDIHNATNVLKKLAMITLASENIEELAHSIYLIESEFDIISESGNSMIYEKCNPNELFNF
jgi:biotin carboxylase